MSTEATPTPASTMAGSTVQPSSSLVLPCTWGGRLSSSSRALPEPPHEEQHADLDEHEHHAGDEEDGDHQVVDGLCLRALRVEGVERRVARAGTEGEQQRDDERSAPAAGGSIGHQPSPSATVVVVAASVPSGT